MIDGHRHLLRAFDLSASGVSVFDLDPQSDGRAAQIELPGPVPLRLTAIVARNFSVEGRSATGFAFEAPSASERAHLLRLSERLEREQGDPVDRSDDDPSLTADLPALEMPVASLVRAVLTGAPAPSAPPWLTEVAEALSETERVSIGQASAPSWVRESVKMRIVAGACRARAPTKNLSRSEFRRLLASSASLSKAGRGRPENELVEIAGNRAQILRALYPEQTPIAPALVPIAAPVAADDELEDNAPSPPKTSPGLDEDAAARLFAAGYFAAAARAYAEIGQVEEAVDLYLNVLGDPKAAAPLARRAFGPQKAAELLQIAGFRDEAAEQLVEAARASADPQQLIPQINALSTRVGLSFTQSLTEAAPLSPRTVETHYLHGLALARSGQKERAGEVLQAISSDFGDYKDIGPRVLALFDPGAEPSIAFDIDVEFPSTTGDIPVDTSSMGALRGEPDGPAPTSPALEVSSPPAIDIPISIAPGDALDLAAEVASPIDEGWTPDSNRPGARVGVELELGEDTSEISGLLGEEVLVGARQVSLARLKKKIVGLPCNETTVGDFHKYALFSLSTGAWDRAKTVLDRIEGSVPGYPGVRERLELLAEWGPTTSARLPSLEVALDRARDRVVRYRIRGELARNANSTVYRVTDRSSGLDAVLKLFAADSLPSTTERRASLDRLTTISRLTHPGIARLTDFGVVDERLFFAEDFELTTLERQVDESGHLSTLESLNALFQLAGALAFVHGQGIKHGAVKSSNVRRNKIGVLKLGDFRVSPSAALGGSAELSAGSLAYRSPEWLDGSEPSASTDVFAAGVVLFELLTGHFPFEGTERDRPTSVRTHTASRPEWVDALVRRILKKDPFERPTAPQILQFISKINEAVAAASSRSTVDLPDRQFKF